MRTRVMLVLLLTFLTGCDKKAEPQSKTASSAAQATPASIESAAQPAASKPETPLDKATVGNEAPDFAMPNLEGGTVRLSDFEGKRVVLEWFNPECPFVRLAHTKGSLKGLAEKYEGKDVVWLAVNSGAKGRQGHGVEVNRAGRDKLGFDYPVLLDENGRVGRAYGATNTPHLFIIDEDGVLVYAGAIDNSPDGEGQSPTSDTLVNYVDAAMEDLDADRPVRTSKTAAYGCSVKYDES